jgi:tRNA pseudouridine55 synthase
MRRRLDAVLLLDKVPGMSSNAALQSARRIYAAAKAGHGGTLDPLASGLLPVLFGEATKFSGWMLDAGKTYRATLEFGIRTDSGDAEGNVISRRTVSFDDAALAHALESFRGDIEQVPPMHSALKRGGKPLYELARKGISVPREARRVRIDRLEQLGRSGPRLELEVACTKGTYIRTLADDLGERLGCGAHLVALRRTAVGDFQVNEASTLDSLSSLAGADLDRVLLPVDRLVAGLQAVTLDGPSTLRFRQGQAVPCAADDNYTSSTTGPRRVYGPAGRFLGLGRLAEAALIRPLRLVADVAQAADNH